MRAGLEKIRFGVWRAGGMGFFYRVVRPQIRHMRALETKIPAPVVAAAMGTAMKLYALKFGVAIDQSAFRMVLGISASQISALIAVAAAYSLWRARTTINPIQPSRASHLVTSGVYRFSRNPLYLSLFLLLAAYAVRLDSLGVWIAPIVFISYVTRFQILPEERALHLKFGEPFARYIAQTRRWI